MMNVATMGLTQCKYPCSFFRSVDFVTNIAQIEKDFQSCLESAWREHKERILNTAAVHLQDYQQRQADFDRHYQHFVQETQTQQDEMKQQLESLRAKFSELSGQVQGDIDRLEDKYVLHDPKRTTAGKVKVAFFVAGENTLVRNMYCHLQICLFL